MIAAGKAGAGVVDVRAMKVISRCICRKLPTTSTGVPEALPTLSTIAQLQSLLASMTIPKRINSLSVTMCAILVGALIACGTAHASDARARADYMIHCQGCHVPDGSGFVGRVPDLGETLPLFLSVDGGREFLIQVPGSSQSALSDARLAGVLNWIIKSFSNGALPASFVPYETTDITAVRSIRLDDVFATRDALIGHLEGQNGRSPE